MSAPAREKYLRIAAQLVTEEVAGEFAPSHLAGQARLDEVAKRLGTPRSSLYRSWNSQLDYWRDLVRYAVTTVSLPISEVLAPAEVHDWGSLIEVYRHRFDHAAEVLVSDAKHMLRFGLVGYPRIADLNTLAAAAERHEREAAASHLATMLERVGRRPIAPLTMVDLVTAMGLLLDGALVYGRTYPWFVEHRITLEGDPGRSWSLPALAMRAMLSELTEPGKPTVDHDDPGPNRAEPSAAAPSHEAEIESQATWTPAQVAALEAGIAIVGGPGSATDIAGGDVVLGHVTLARVARAAGVTRRQMYHLWPTQAQFRFELIDYLVKPNRDDFMNRFAGAVERAVEAGRDRFVLELVEAINLHRRTEQDPPFDVSFALQPVLGDPALAEWRRQSRRSLLEDFRGRITLLAQLWGAAPLGGLTLDDVSGLNLLGSAGSERLHIADPQALRYDIPWRGGRYSLYAILNQALMEHVLVMPAEPGPSGS